MVQKFELYSKASLSRSGEINIVNDPMIREEINGSYVLDFDIDYRDRDKLNANTLVKADGQYFQIARIVKSRYDTINLSVNCEHVTYELITDVELETNLEFESDAQTMITDFLKGSRFTLLSCIPTGVKYYTTSSLDIRKRLFEIADLFGGELVFDNFNVSLVSQRGSRSGLTVELGVNLRGVTEEIDFVQGSRSYEIDLVDLSKVPGYDSRFSEISLGDEIGIIDNKLGINASERVLSIEYNPFQKELPSVTVGDYVRDLTEYFKDMEEEKEDDEDKPGGTLESFLTEFRIGLFDALTVASDETYAVESYIRGEERHVKASSSYTVRKEGSLEGIFATVASDYADFNLYLINTTYGENKTRTTVYNLKNLGSSSNPNTWDVPYDDEDSFTVFVSEKTIEELQANPNLLDTTKHGAIGVTIKIGSDRASQFLYKFEVGEKSVLGNCSDEFLQAISFIKGEQGDIVASGEYLLKKLDKEEITDSSGRFEKFKGLVAELLEEYQDRNYHFYLVDTLIAKDGSITTTVMDWNNASGFNPQSWDVPDGAGIGESFTFIISEKTWDELRADESLFYNSDFGAIGVRFLQDIDDQSPLLYFDRFDLQDFDLLDELENQNEQLVKYITMETPLISPKNEFEIGENQIGLFVEKAAGYGGEYLTLIDFRMSGDINRIEIVPYTSVQWDWNWTATYEKRGIIIVMSKIPFDQMNLLNIEENFICSFGVTIVKDEDAKKSNADRYLSEFRIGDVDMLPIASDETSQVMAYLNGEITYVEASAVYRTSENLIGFYAQLRSEYAGYHLTLLDTYFDNGDIDMYSDTWEELLSYNPQNWLSPDNSDKISYTLVISEVAIADLLNSGYDGSFLKAFGVTIEGGNEDDDDLNKTYFEYGKAPLADVMELFFENGPYGEVMSVTTGISGYASSPLPRMTAQTTSDVSLMNYSSSGHITITTEPIYNSSMLHIGIRAYAYMGGDVVYERSINTLSSYYGDLDVNFHAVCKKGTPLPIDY